RVVLWLVHVNSSSYGSDVVVIMNCSVPAILVSASSVATASLVAIIALAVGLKASLHPHTVKALKAYIKTNRPITHTIPMPMKILRSDRSALFFFFLYSI